jgi:flagellar hook-associated protein 1
VSTFSGLNTALSGLNASRTGLNTVGQNLTNVNTAGYTRQRVDFTALGAPARGALSDLGVKTGQGVTVTSISRLGDSFLDARVRTNFSAAGYTSVRADALSSIEGTLGEPGDNGMSTKLQNFWGAWSELSSHTGDTGSAAVLLQKSAALAQGLSNGYSALNAQWSQARTNADTVAKDINSTASQVAALNDHIRTAQASGAPHNELIDQRNTLTERIAQMAGGTVRDLADGTNEILLGGNVLVSGNTANAVKVTGAAQMADGAPVQLQWDKPNGSAVDLDGGQLAGLLSVLAPAAADGTGGPIAQTAKSYNDLATKIAETVNTAHRTGATADGTTGLDFFSFKAGVPAAMGLTVIPKDASGIAAGTVGAGGMDGSMAEAISQLGKGPDSPDAFWSKTVVSLAVDIKSGLEQAATANTSLTNAVANQQANASVDIDEENVNLLTFQHAYQAAARVMTAIDETLDVLINQTGRVGR